MKSKFLLFLKGIAIGLANIIPGVSGGTIALITEVYEDLINSIKSFDMKALKFLLKFEIKKLFNHINFYFLLPILLGTILSVFISTKILTDLFEKENEHLIWSLFFGLILSSAYFIGKKVKEWSLLNIILVIIGIIIAIILTFLNPSQENDSFIFVFLCGFIGIVGMMVPGLSGSFIIILMGNYALMLNFIEGSFLLKKESLYLLSVFMTGSVIGLISFSRIIAWLLKHYKENLLSLLTGFILGSLLLIWPWQECVNFVTDNKEKCIDTVRYLPEINNSLLNCILLITLGFLMVWWLEKINLKKKV